MISAPSDIGGLELFKMFVHELGKARVCSMLDVHYTTLNRWLNGSQKLPRMAVLALYWETQYGKSMIETDQVNEIRLLYRRVRILEYQYTKAKDIVTGLRRLHSGTANEPFFDELPDLASTNIRDGHYGHTNPGERDQEANAHHRQLGEVLSHLWPSQATAG